MFSQRRSNAIQAVVKALEKHPEASDRVTLYSDNGSQYISDAFGESMKVLGIEHRFIAYNTPEQNGYIESFHGRFKREYVWLYDFKSFQELIRTSWKHSWITTRGDLTPRSDT